MFALVWRTHHLNNRMKNDQHAIITLTDNAPHALNISMARSPPFRWRLAKSVPGLSHPAPWHNDFVSKLGMFCTSTPFVTRRLHALTFNDSVSSSGAVRIARSAAANYIPLADT